MNEQQGKNNLELFRKILKIEISGAVKSSDYTKECFLDEKRKKALLQTYGGDITNAMMWASSLNSEEYLSFKRLLQLYTSESFWHFFYQLRVGENNEQMERIAFKLVMVNEKTQEENILIDVLIIQKCGMMNLLKHG